MAPTVAHVTAFENPLNPAEHATGPGPPGSHYPKQAAIVMAPPLPTMPGPCRVSPQRLRRHLQKL